MVVAALRPPLLVLGFVFGNIYKLCFGWLDKRTAKKDEERFADDIRTHLSFLFSECGAHIVPNEGVSFPPSFDGAYVTVAVGSVCVFVEVAVTFRSVWLLNLLRRIGRVFGYWLTASVSGTLPNPGRPTLTHWRVSSASFDPGWRLYKRHCRESVSRGL